MSIENLIRPLWARNSEVTDSIQPEFKLVWDIMAVLFTRKFDEDPIKNERASLEKTFSHYKFMGNFRRSRAANSIVSGPIWPKVDLVRDFMHVFVICKYKMNRIKNNRGNVETS